VPSYRAPGVFIEEPSSGSRPITPVSTSTAAFIGVAPKGPVNKATLVTSPGEFEKIFGTPYRVTATDSHYLGYAVPHFFQQGGGSCYVVRVAHYTDINDATTLQATPASELFDGTAPNGAAVVGVLRVSAISPGVWGRALTAAVLPSSRFSVRLNADITAGANTQIAVAETDQVQVGSLLWVVEEVSARVQSVAGGVVTFATPMTTSLGVNFAGNINTNIAVFGPGMTYVGRTNQGGAIAVTAGTPPVGISISPATKLDGSNVGAGDVLTFAITEARIVVQSLSAAPGATIVQFPSQTLPGFLANRGRVYSREFMIQVRQGSVVLETHENLSLVNSELGNHVNVRLATARGASQLIVATDESGTNDGVFLDAATKPLTGGNDGLTNLNDADFTGSELLKTGLHALTPVRDASILAIPNASETVAKAAIAYCDKRGDLFLIIERPRNSADTIQAYRQKLGSKYAAIYHPWIQMDDPFTGQKLLVPPSGAVAGVYSFTDARRGVHKAPAGLDTGKVVVANGIETIVTKPQYDVLYPDSINATLKLRDGIHVWGSRTISPDPEWRQINVRRLFIFLEKSIENGTQWVTFEPNHPTLWKSIERNISAFLRIQWLEGKLVGNTEKDAFFVRCNAETNPPEVVAAGQVVTIIGAAPSRPAEFVIFRIKQKVGQAAG
jgi:phage tail sheath protein FI